MNKVLQKAIEMNSKGMSIIAVNRDKKPCFEWKEYQERLATLGEIESWWEKYPTANVGVVTGKISGITVIDVEKGGDISRFPETFTIKTGGGGWHLYYKYFPFQNKTRVFPLTDVRGDGGYVVAPPSVHQSGEKYEILLKKSMAPFPYELFGASEDSKWKEKAAGSLTEGSRNTDLTSIVGGLLARFPQDEWSKIVWPMVADKNKAQKSPLPDEEIKAIFDSVGKREMQKRNSGGEIRDIYVESKEEEVLVKITLAQSVVCFKARNIINNLLEAKLNTWIEKTSGLSHEIPYNLRINSDSNKDQLASLLKKTFDRKEDKEIYPWTILVAKVCAELEKIIREHRQDFSATESIAKEVTWMYEPFIQEDQINVFFGLGSSGKTLISLYLATLLGRQNCNSMLIDYENDRYGWKNQVDKLVGKDGNQSFYTYYDTEQIPLADQVDKLKEVIKRRNIKLIIVDSASMASGDSTIDEKSALRLISALKMLRTTIILIAHQRKNDGDKTPIGSIQYENQARNVWNFQKESDEFDQHILHIACKHTKANNTWLRRDLVGFKVSFTESHIEIEGEDTAENFLDKQPIKKRIERLLKNDPGMSPKELSGALQVSVSAVSKNLSEGKVQGLFDNKGGKWILVTSSSP